MRLKGRPVPEELPPKPAAACPICGKPVPVEGAAAARLRPFCSPRCADVDLGRWFGGAYAIPGPPPEFDEDPPDSESGDIGARYRS